MIDRILQLGKFYPPEWGGVEAVTANLAEGFAARGLYSEVLAFTRGTPGRFQNNGVELTRCQARLVIKSQPLSGRWIAEAVRMSRTATTVIVHWPNILGAVALLFIRHTRVVTFWHAGVIKKGWLGLLTRPLTRYLLERSSIILVTSDSVAQTSDFSHVRTKVRVLPIGIADPAAHLHDSLPSHIAKFLAGRPFAFAVGRLVPYKGFDQLILAARSLPPGIAVVIAGGGPQEKALSEIVTRNGLEDRVLIAGQLPGAHLNALFAAASVFVLPSVDKAEAFGVVQLEAMAHGLPIVATDIPESGAAWVSGMGSTGALVPIASPDHISEAIVSIVNHPDRETLCQLSRQRFEQLFTVERMVDLAVELLERGGGMQNPEASTADAEAHA